MQSNKIKVKRAIRQCKIVLLNNKLKTADTGSLYSDGSLCWVDCIYSYFSHHFRAFLSVPDPVK